MDTLEPQAYWASMQMVMEMTCIRIGKEQGESIDANTEEMVCYREQGGEEKACCIGDPRHIINSCNDYSCM